MRRVIGIDIHRTFGEVVIGDNGSLRHAGRVDMTRTGLEGFGRSLRATDEVVIEATGNCMAVSRVLSPLVKRVAIANPLQVKAIAHARIKTDKVDAGTLASLYAAGYLPEVWTPDAATERMRRLAARRYQVVRHRTRLKNEVHAILHAHLIPKCPHSDLFNQRGRAWLSHQPVPDDERAAIERHIRELDRLGEDLDLLEREIAESTLDDPAVKRLMTITGVNLTVAAALMAAIGDIGRFKSPQKLVSYFGLNPRVRQSGLGAAHHGRISKIGRIHARAMLVEAAWAAAKAPGPLHAFFVRIRARRATRSPPSPLRASWRSCAGTCSPRKATIGGRGRHWWPTSCVQWSCRPAARNERATGAGPHMPTTSRPCAYRKCGSPDRPSTTTSGSSTLGANVPRRIRCADASNRQGVSEAARQRFQPQRRSSPRGRPRTQYHGIDENACQSHPLYSCGA